MAALSNYLENKLIDLILRGQSFSSPANVYVALYTCSNGVLARSTAYTSGETVVTITADGTYHLYKCTTAGTSASSAPSYPGVANEGISDGSCIFTEQSSSLAGGGGTEVSGGSYARVTVADSLTAWAGTQGAGTTTASSGTSGLSSNNAAITFPTSSSAWTTSPAMVWGVGLYDASSGGNLLGFGPLTIPQNIGSGTAFSISAALFTFTLQ